jgi:hypothetical protein
MFMVGVTRTRTSGAWQQYSYAGDAERPCRIAIRRPGLIRVNYAGSRIASISWTASRSKLWAPTLQQLIQLEDGLDN